uniref:Uncharacterized protein n=1 Tax=Vitis vinifera TaxID=29760 RepID=A5ALN5_VITVI|nr:hypothetical protein VITISV_035240 [Vitis vinifera]
MTSDLDTCWSNLNKRIHPTSPFSSFLHLVQHRERDIGFEVYMYIAMEAGMEGVHGHIEIDIWKVGVDVLGEFKERLTRLGEGDWSLRRRRLGQKGNERKKLREGDKQGKGEQNREKTKAARKEKRKGVFWGMIEGSSMHGKGEVAPGFFSDVSRHRATVRFLRMTLRSITKAERTVDFKSTLLIMTSNVGEGSLLRRCIKSYFVVCVSQFSLVIRKQRFQSSFMDLSVRRLTFYHTNRVPRLN